MFGLKDSVIEKIQSVFEEYSDISEVKIYGSRAKGNFRNGSDIDLAFLGNNLTINLLFKLEDKIDDLFLPYSFDLLIYDNLENDNLKDHINRIGKPFYKGNKNE